MNAVFEERLESHPVRTGDLIATVDGGASFYGMLFKVIGELIPGRPDHLALYLGPDGICAEAGPRGVILFRFFDGHWDAARMLGQRGVADTFFGVRPLPLARAHERAMRSAARNFVLDQLGKPYNLNFSDPDREDAFYCSQLACAACKAAGIHLNIDEGKNLHPLLPQRIVTPEEVWKACAPNRPE